MARAKRGYTPEQVQQAMEACVRSGSLRGAAKETGIPWETIRDWKRSDEGAALYKEARNARRDETLELWLAATRDAAEGLAEAVLRCRQALRAKDLKGRDAALIARALADLLSDARAAQQDEPEEERSLTVMLYRGEGVPPEMVSRSRWGGPG